jgi:2-polyprenylphenol hydroxylase and related flavodoxin oxidoreductases
MLTDYETGEKPFSLSMLDEEKFSITIKKVGKFTTRLFEMKEGNKLYIRGPYGNVFKLHPEGKTQNQKLLVIGGGCGIAPLRFLIYRLTENKSNKITIILGGRTKAELLFLREFNSLGIKVLCTTDDASYGVKGTAVDNLKLHYEQERYNYFYAAGPEPMLKNAFEYLKDKQADGEFLLERYMKCGIGICGQCTIDPVGIRMCIEGPVVKKDVIAQLTEFGNYTRDAYGSRRMFSQTDITCK